MAFVTPSDRLPLLAVFHALPGAYLLLSPEFIIEEVSGGYLAETLTARDQLVGRYLFEAFPDNPRTPQAQAAHNLRASLKQVLATGQPHQMPLQHYDVPHPHQPGEFVERYWLATNTPILDAEGQVRHLLHSVVNVTDEQRAQAQLRDSEQSAQAKADQLVRATLDSSMAIIQVFEAVRDEASRIVDFRWTLVNERAAAQYDIDLVGQRLLTLNPGVVEAGIFARFVQVVESGQPQAYEQEYRHEQYDGWFEQSVVKLNDGVVSTTTDITTRKRAEEALRAAHARTVDILEGTADAFYALDADFHFTYVNQRAAQLWGRAPEELLGRHYWTEFPAAVGSDSYQQHYRVQQTGQSAHFEIVSPLLNTWIDVSIYPGVAGGLSVFFRDITARKHSEEALRRSEQHLQAANGQLLRINRDLDTFVYAASHDLKAPIANIEGLLHALRAHLPASVLHEADTAYLLHLMDESVARFQTTLNHLTDLSRLQQLPTLPVEAVPLAPIVEAVRLDLQPELLAAPGAQLRIDVDACPRVPAAPKDLRSILYNLLSNALKYAHPERPAEVTLRCARVAGEVVLEVQDNGLGLSEQQQGQLFGLFRRLHTHVPGTGVGLYTVKRLMENAGGRLTVESQPGVGSTFRVAWPA